jgi:formylglycine-generating enzyme required for sulfatase activity
VTNAGDLSPYGTMGQGGNVWEWNESAFAGTNSSSSEDRAIRGGFWGTTESYLRSSLRDDFFVPTFEDSYVGFRVASVPEPSTAVLVLMAGGAWLLRRRLRRSL